MLAALESTLDLAFRVFDALLDELSATLASRFEFIVESGGLLGCADEGAVRIVGLPVVR